MRHPRQASYDHAQGLGSHSQCQLQQSLSNLNYCGRNYLKINVNKTKCIKFRRGGRLAVDEKFYLSKREYEFTNTFCYPGVIFSSTLSPSHHLKPLMNKAYQSVASLNQKLNLHKVNFMSAQQLLHSIVFPASTYGLETYVDELFEIEINTGKQAFFLGKARSEHVHLNQNAIKQVDVS